MKNVHRACPICSGSSAAVLHHQRFVLPDGHPLPGAYDVVECATCGFVYADTVGTERDYDRYYAEYSKYVDQGTSTGGGGNPRDRARIEATAAALVGQLSGPQAQIVDIGCANGGLLGALKAKGYPHVFGIDPAVACVENTRRLFDVPAAQGWLTALPANTPRADLVIVSHVLEHVLNLRESLRHIASILAPGGMIYVEVPDAQRYVECLAAPFQDFNTEHINHFGAASLENLMAACGFAPRVIGTKMIETAEGIDYPALFGFFRRAEEPHGEWKQDGGFLRSIRSYVTASRAQLEGFEQRFRARLDGPVIVWGTGQLTLKLLAETCLGAAQIAAFVDGNPVNHGKRLRGVEIVAPEAVPHLPPHPIIIGTTLHHVPIMRRARQLGLGNELITLSGPS